MVVNGLLGGFLLLLIAVLMFIVIVMAIIKKRWYFVYTADNQKLLLSRRVWVWEVSGTAVFRDETNRRVIISKHWILKIVELSKVDLEKEQNVGVLNEK
jgi:hypothetical protein